MPARTLMLLLFVPAWAWAQTVCEPGAGASDPGRFEAHADGTVTDLRARLTWMRCAIGQQWRTGTCVNQPQRYSWEDAKAIAQRINADGQYFYNDWRLPTMRELATITELHCWDPRINTAIFPQTRADFYWSASTKLVDGPELVAFAMNFGPQGFQPRRLQETSLVRLVRTALD